MAGPQDDGNYPDVIRCRTPPAVLNSRPGNAFKVHASAQPAYTPVYRFHPLPPGHDDSHFHSASPAECALVHEVNPAYVLESTSVMQLALPDP
jgi:hypothetical protein